MKSRSWAIINFKKIHMEREMRVAYLLHIFFLRPYIRECARVDIHRVALSVAAPYIKFKFCVKYFTIFIFRIGYKKEETVTVPHIHTLLCELFVCMYLQFNIRWCLTLLRERIRSYKLYARVGIRKKIPSTFIIVQFRKFRLWNGNNGTMHQNSQM